MLKIFAVAGAITLLSFSSVLATPIDTITVTGIWNSGTTDVAGLFGTAGASLGNKAYTVTYSFNPSTLTLQGSSAGCTTNCTYNFGTNGLTETLTALDGTTLVTDSLVASNGSVMVCGAANGCGSIRFDISGVNSDGINISDLHLYANEQIFTSSNVNTDPTFLNVLDAGGSLQDQNTFDGDSITGFQTVSVSFANTTVPEPLTLSIFGAGLAGAAAIRRRRNKKKV
jgi:hypothetical protein